MTPRRLPGVPGFNLFRPDARSFLFSIALGNRNGGGNVQRQTRR